MTKSREPSVHQTWAHLRFSVVGHLLAAPPPRGELRGELEKLAGRTWRHPTTGEPATGPGRQLRVTLTWRLYN